MPFGVVILNMRLLYLQVVADQGTLEVAGCRSRHPKAHTGTQ